MRIQKARLLSKVVRLWICRETPRDYDSLTTQYGLIGVRRRHRKGDQQIITSSKEMMYTLAVLPSSLCISWLALDILCLRLPRFALKLGERDIREHCLCSIGSDLWTVALVDDLRNLPDGKLGGLVLLLFLVNFWSFLRSLWDMLRGAIAVDVMLNTFSLGLILFLRVLSELLWASMNILE